MDFFFVDDARQRNPSRPGMKSLLGIGGVHVPEDQVALLERAIQNHCDSIGFPRNEQFKWSPSRDSFQWKNIHDNKREAFFLHILGLAKQHGAKATVVICDEQYRTSVKNPKSHEEFITTLFLERCDWAFHTKQKEGLVVLATHGGGRKDDTRFTERCLEILREGTDFIDFTNMALGVVTAPSKQMRLLQLADIIASCTVARVSGENNYSPPIFEAIKPLFHSDGSRIGGIGLKLHPDFTYANLYHWLLDDTHIYRGNTGTPLPMKNIPYATSAEEPSLKKVLTK